MKSLRLFGMLVLLPIVSALPQTGLAAEGGGRSLFRYVDEQKAPRSRYAAPTDTDPRNVDLDGIRARLLGLEERVEELERRLGTEASQ